MLRSPQAPERVLASKTRGRSPWVDRGHYRLLSHRLRQDAPGLAMVAACLRGKRRRQLHDVKRVRKY